MTCKGGESTTCNNDPKQSLVECLIYFLYIRFIHTHSIYIIGYIYIGLNDDRYAFILCLTP